MSIISANTTVGTIIMVFPDDDSLKARSAFMPSLPLPVKYQASECVSATKSAILETTIGYTPEGRGISVKF